MKPWDRLGLPLGPRQDQLLRSYERLLATVAVPRGMISRRDAPRIAIRHIADSLRAVPLLKGLRDAYDLGSGAGLPGIPLAIALPAVRFVLVEPTARRSAFLELAVQELGLANTRVAVGRAEDLTELVDACVARALAPLERSWDLARPLLRPGGRLVHFAGGRLAAVPALQGAASLRIVRSDLLENAGPIVMITAE